MRFGAIRYQVVSTTPHRIQKMSLNHGPAIGRHFQALGKLKNQRSRRRKTRCFVSVLSVKQLVPEFYVWNKFHFVFCGAPGSLRIIFLVASMTQTKHQFFWGWCSHLICKGPWRWCGHLKPQTPPALYHIWVHTAKHQPRDCVGISTGKIKWSMHLIRIMIGWSSEMPGDQDMRSKSDVWWGTKGIATIGGRQPTSQVDCSPLSVVDDGHLIFERWFLENDRFEGDCKRCSKCFNYKRNCNKKQKRQSQWRAKNNIL